MLKNVKIVSNKGIKIFGKCLRPNEINSLNVRQIFSLLCTPGIKVYEILEDNKTIQLNLKNYNKDNKSALSVIKPTENNIDNKLTEQTKVQVKATESNEEDKSDESLQEKTETVVIHEVEEEPESTIEEDSVEVQEDNKEDVERVSERAEHQQKIKKFKGKK